MSDDIEDEKIGNGFTSDELATLRTMLAADRTLMAWIRTSLSLESFGFTIYKVLQGFAARSGVPLTPLQDPDADPKLWRGASPPPVLAARLDALGVKLDALGWAALDEEARYALCKLAGPRKGPEKLAAAVEELGLRNR